MRFESRDGRSIPGITTEQMREVDRVAIDELGPNLFQMMENAGRSLATECLARTPDARAPILVLAGAGGNGGGAICAGRHLANRDRDVRLLLAAADDRMGAVPRQQLDLARAAGVVTIEAADLATQRPATVLDGLIGYSLHGAPRPPLTDLIDWINGQPATVIALDVPSGLDATTGETPGVCVRATVTLTLALPKTGLTHPNVGELILADLGIPSVVFERAGITYASPFTGPHRLPIRVSDH